MLNTKLNDFGAMLRAERERLGISLRQISTSTRLSMATLEALERNDVSSLAGGVFVRSFVRAYAVEVGLDPEETIREFLARCPTESVHVGNPYTNEPNEHAVFRSQQQMAITVATLLLLSVPLTGSLLLTGFFARTEQPPALAGGAEIMAPTVATPEREADPELPREPVVAEVPLLGEAVSSSALTIAIQSRADCWVSLTLDGHHTFSKVVRAGERDIFKADREIVITVGDAGAFTFAINERPGRALGQDGEVVTARISRDNYRSFTAE